MSQEPFNVLSGEKPAEISIPLHTNTNESVSIIIVSFNRPEYLNILLQSIAVTSYNNNYEIIVVDNNSGAETQKFLDEIEGEVKVVRNDKNLYWSEACNKGVQKAEKGSKYFIFMHEDVVILNPAWIDLLVNVAESKGAGMCGVESSSYMMGDQKVEFIQEHCMLISRECWNDIGSWPVELPMCGHSFIMTLKAQNRGHAPQIMKNSIIHHYRLFGIDINQWEIFAEKAQSILPKLLTDINSRPVGKT